MRSDKLPFFLILFILFIALLVGWWFNQQSPDADQIEVSSQGTARIGGDFMLTNQKGIAFFSQKLEGNYALVFFGFTNCPDICPTALSTMTNALNTLPQDVADQVNPVFITVDPERDTVARMKEYAENFHPRLIALTGDKRAVSKAASAFKVFYQTADVPADASGNYMINHSGYIYFMGPEGEYIRHFTADDDATTLTKAILDEVRKSNP